MPRSQGSTPARRPSSARRLTGYLPGELKPPAHSTAIGFLAHLGRLRGGVQRRAVEELASRLELDLERKIGDLSKGNKRKWASSRHSCTTPDAADPRRADERARPIRQEDVLELVRERAAAGRTVFLSSHELDQVERVAERIGIVKEGRLVAVDSIVALKERAVRRVEVRLAGSAEGLERLRDVPGVESLARDGDVVRLEVHGSMDALVKALAAFPVQTLTSRPPSWTRSSSPTTGARMRAEVALQTLRERRRSLLWWSLGLVAFVALNIAFYPSIRGDTAINDYVKDLPESLRGLFAGGELDIASPAGCLNSQVFALMAPLILLIFAVGAGVDAVAGEEERGTLDFLLAHPLRRRHYVVQRVLALTALVAGLSASCSRRSGSARSRSISRSASGASSRPRRASACWRSSSAYSLSRRARSGRAAPARSQSPRASRSRRGSSTGSARRSTFSMRGARSRPTTRRSAATRCARAPLGWAGAPSRRLRRSSRLSPRPGSSAATCASSRHASSSVSIAAAFSRAVWRSYWAFPAASNAPFMGSVELRPPPRRLGDDRPAGVARPSDGLPEQARRLGEPGAGPLDLRRDRREAARITGALEHGRAGGVEPGRAPHGGVGDPAAAAWTSASSRLA